MTNLIRCAWCNKEFESTQPEQIYCKRKHSEQARVRRARAKRLGLICLKPYKAYFPTKEAADFFLEEHHLWNQFSYKCPAELVEHYHVATDRNKS